VSPGVSIEFKELVRARTDIVSLIGETLALSPRRGGQDYVALCPFHDDHNPSFHVYPERQTYRCWACNEGGDCFSWVMKTENVDFPEALRMLAERAHLEMPKTAKAGRGSSQSKAELYEVLAWAERQFHQCLLHAPEAERARRYLMEDRGFSQETIQAYGLGYHPRDWQWLLDRARNVYRPELLYAARLVRERRGGVGYRDDFVGRILFPIRDVRGRTVAFGARVLPDDSEAQGPKYLNSPESALFTKSRLLFGLDLARHAIKDAGTAVVVEGYTDCIAAYQAGIRNVVGTLGTALTEHHVLGLKRWAERVVLVYDGDTAGQAAAERSLSRFLAYDTDLRLMTLPEGEDPAEFLANRGAEAFRERVDQAEEALEYKLRLEIGRYGLDTVRAREQVMLHVLELLSESPRVAGTPREDAILGQLARRLAISEQNVRRHLSEMRSSRRARREAASRSGWGQTAMESGADVNRVDRLLSGTLSADEKLECELLEIILSVPVVFDQVRHELTDQDFGHPSLRQLFVVCCELADQSLEPSIDRVLTTLEDADLKRLATWLDAQAAQKDVPGVMRRSVHSPGDLPNAPLLRAVLERVRWRRERTLHEQVRGQLAGQNRLTGGLDEHAKTLLRRAAEFHQKRIVHKEPLT